MSAQAEAPVAIMEAHEPQGPPLSPALLRIAQIVLDPVVPDIPNIYSHVPATPQELSDYTRMLYRQEPDSPPIANWLTARGLRNSAFSTERARRLARDAGAENFEADIDDILDETREQIEIIESDLSSVSVRRGKRPIALMWKAMERAHMGELRLSGRPTIMHPIEVAAINLHALKSAASAPAIRPYGDEFRLFLDTDLGISLTHDVPEGRQSHLRWQAEGDPRAVINEGQLMISAYTLRVMMKDMKPAGHPLQYDIGEALRAFAHRQNAAWMPDYLGGIVFGSQRFMYCVTKAADSIDNGRVEPKPPEANPIEEAARLAKLRNYERVPEILSAQIGNTLPPTPIRHLPQFIIGQHYFGNLAEWVRDKTSEELQAEVGTMVDDLYNHVFY